MPARPARSFILALPALAVLAAWPAAATANEALFKAHCGKCHLRAQSVANRLRGNSPEARSAALAKFLETHRPLDPAVRAAVAEYLLGLRKP